MTKTMKIMMLLLLTMVGTGQAWADEPQPQQFGHITYNGTAANDGGTLTFYDNAKDAGLGQYAIAPNGDGPTDLSEIQIWNGVDVDNLGTGFFIMATPAVGHRLPVPDANGNVSFIHAEVVTSVQQAPLRRDAPDPTIEVGQTLPVKFYGYYSGLAPSDPATEYYGLYYVVMPADANLSVSITATFPEVATNATAIDYVDVDGTTKSKAAGTVYVLDGTEARLGYGSFNYQTEHETWYVLPENLTYTNGLELYGKVHLILADGKTMTYDGTERFIYSFGNLDIYGQGGETEGTINAKSTEENCINVTGYLTINGGNISAESTNTSNVSHYGIKGETLITINGGTVNGKSNVTGIGGCNIYINGGIVNGTGTHEGISTASGTMLTITGGHVCGIGDKFGMRGMKGLIITGGQIEATSGTGDDEFGIYSDHGDIILGWTNADDYIKANSYHCGTAGKGVKTVDGKRLVAFNAATGTAASTIVSGTVADVTTLAGKTLKPLDGNYVSINTADFTFSGTTSTTSPFTITTGEGENTTTTHYYIYKKDDTATLSYTGSGFVQVTGLPEGYATVENQPLQRTFTMAATDVALTATAVTGLTATAVTYDGTARTPEIKQGDDDFDAANYTIVYKLGDADVTAADVKDVNTYTCTLTGLGQYVGTATVPFSINKADYVQPDITKYVPQDKAGSFTIDLPELPEGASYSCDITEGDNENAVISTAPTITSGKLTFTTNSGKDAGTTGKITVAATGADNYNDYSFTLNVVVSEYTTAYAWDPQTNIYLIGNDWAFCDRDEVEKPYHDNELVWSADGVTLNTAKIAVNGGTPSSVTYKVDGTVLTAGENTLVLAPGVHRLEITGDDGKLDDWVDFKVIKLIENDPNFVFTVTENPVRFAAPEEAEDQGLRVSPGSGLIAECKPKVKVTYNGTDVTNSENTTLWHRSNGFTYDDEALYNNDTYRTQARGITGYQSTYTLDNGQYSANMHVYNVSGSTSLDGVSRLDVVCGQLLWHHEGETINKKVDLDGVAVSSGVDGGYVYYVGINCPDFYLKDDGKVYYEDETGEQLEEANKTYTDGKDIFYAGGEAIFQYDNFICFGQYSFYLNDTNPAPLCESYKILSDIIGDCHCPKDGDGNCTSCFSQNGNTLTVCGETIEMGPYIVVGDNFILTGNRAIYNIVPSETQTTSPALFSTTIDGSTITFCGYSIDAGNRPIIKGNFWLYPLHLGKGIYIPSAYARYETEPYCYMIARSDFDVEVRRSVVSINDCKSEYKAGEDVEFTIKTCSYKYPEDKDIYKGSTGDIIVYLNNKFYETISHGGNPSHNVNLDELPAGTYQVHVVLAGDEGYQGAEATATFTVVRNDSEVTLTGKQNTAGAAFKTGDEIEYDPENPIVVNAVNDQAVSDTNWKWQISNTSDAGVVELGQTVNNSGNNAPNSEDIYLNTIGLGTVKLWAGFSGNDLYNPAKEAITFKVVPKIVTSPIIKMVSDETIYYDGQEKEPEVKVYYAEGKEIPTNQYTVTYQNNTDASTESSKAKIIVKSNTGALYTINNAEKEFYIQETAVTITELPTASIISDGKTLAASTLTGGKAKAGELDIEGTFAWKDATVAPTTDDSNVTEFDVTFTPDNRNYKLGECKVKLTVMPRAMLFADNTANLWATFCGEHEYEVPEGCTAYTISGISGSTVTTSEVTAENENGLVIIPAYTPVLIQRGENVTAPVKATFIAIGTAPASGYNAQTGLAWSEGSNFAFYGNAGDEAISASNASSTTEGGFIYVGRNANAPVSYVLRNGQFILVDQNQGLAAHRCVLNVETGGMSAYQAPKKLTISKDDITGVKEVKEVREVKDDSWYTLDGRKLNGKPTKKGIYVNGGRKVVVK